MFKCCFIILALVFLSSYTNAHKSGYKIPVPRGSTTTSTDVQSTIRNILAGIKLTGQQNSGQSSLINSPEYEKMFYFFQAPPEEDITKTPAYRRALQMVKKNVQVIFIKSPENKGFEDAVLQLLKNFAEQKTHIYVLNKQPDIEELSRKFQALQRGANNKPEVHFVKYRTPEEARNAQQQIRSQYAAGNGAAKDHGTATAGTLNFATIGKTGVSNPNSAPIDKNYAINYLPTGIDVKPGTSYIPLAIRQ